MLSDEEWLYTWEHGRQLARMSNYNNDDYGWDFTYDAGGMRTKRSDGSTTYEYVYNGSQLSYMTVDGNTLQFIYSAAGAPLAVIYNDEYYYYLTNIQGDVIALLDTDATTVVTYTYDAWGNVTVSGPMDDDLGIHNPLRYRGYVYDEETGLYYLQSRYYNPEIGRFINADDISCLGADGSIVSYNLFAYCNNNPVMHTDPTGHAPKWWQSILIGTAIIAVTALAVAAIVTTGGSAAPLIATAGKIALGAVKIAAVSGAIAGTIRVGKSISQGEKDVGDLAKVFAVGFADGFFAGACCVAGMSTTSIAAYRISGMFNNGYGWSSGSWIGGYQTPNTPGVAIATHMGGAEGGRSFGLDIDIYNGFHYHTNKFGVGKPSKWIKAHHWELSAILIGVGVGFADEWSEW